MEAIDIARNVLVASIQMRELPVFDANASWKDIFQVYEALLPSLSESILKRQFVCFSEGNSPELADERIKAIPIVENGEELVDLSEMGNSYIWPMDNPARPYQGMDFGAGLPESYKVRKGVYACLQRMLKELNSLSEYFGYLPGQISIKLFEGVRSVESQTMIFNVTLERFRKEHPEMSQEELEAETSKWVSPVKNNIPPHSTGAAMDIRLWDNLEGEFFDVCGFTMTWSPKEVAPLFAEDRRISVKQRLNRLYMAFAAERAGLVNYAFENWHYSSGDRYAAFWRVEGQAVYGSAKI